MKNCLTVILGLIFVLALSESAFAIHAEIPSETRAVAAKDDSRITLGGEVRIRGWYTSNIGDSSEQNNPEKTAQDGHTQKSTPQINTSQTGK